MNFLEKTPPKFKNLPTVAKMPPIIARHFPDEDLALFARAAMEDAHGKHQIHPDDLIFVDHAPPNIPTPTDQPEPHDIVAALRSARPDRAA